MTERISADKNKVIVEEACSSVDDEVSQVTGFFLAFPSCVAAQVCSSFTTTSLHSLQARLQTCAYLHSSYSVPRTMASCAD